MNAQEISVAVAEKLCVIFVVLNDRALGMVKTVNAWQAQNK